jgi:hypothetical protein
MSEQERPTQERLAAAAERLRESEAWQNRTYDQDKITTDDQGKPVLLARRHDDHTKWDEIAR